MSTLTIAYLVWVGIAIINTAHIVWKTRPHGIVEAIVVWLLGILWPISIPLYFVANRKLSKGQQPHDHR
jgi:hypothetical protein